MVIATAADRGTTINRVRLRGPAGLDPLSARLRAERAIGQVVDGVTLAPGAILCVRRVGDPRPGRLTLRAWQPPPPEWARAVGQTLADLARRAARPIRGSVAADAEAVFFDDRAQMLACLAADWCRGSIASRWWWRALLGGPGEADVVLRAWRQQPAHVAAALEEVARLGLAAAFVGRLTPHAAAVLLEAVVEAHGLRRSLVSDARVEPRRTSVPDEAPVTGSPRAAGAARDAAGVVAPPWQRSAPEACVAGLRADQKLLLGVALTVRRDPARARDPNFASEVARWREQAPAFSVPRAARAGGAAPADTSAVSSAPADDVVAAAAAEPPSGEAADPGPARAPRRSPPDEPMETRATDPAAPVGEHDGPPDAAARPTEALLSRGDRVGDVGLSGLAIETGLGGLFYLLNVAIALGLYGDFTAPLGPRLDLSIWRYVALVGAALLRGRHRRDPIWRLLADLAGPDRPAFRGAAQWRLDPSWLAAFPDAPVWRWSADAARVRVRHPAGFLVLDLERSPDRSPADQVRDEVERYRLAHSFRLVHRPVIGVGPEAELARWTRWHARYVRARLARALGGPRAAIGDLLCRHRARVTLGLAHVDVAFSLADLPVAIRLSGLDRDPGWIPAADRIVSFRYD